MDLQNNRTFQKRIVVRLKKRADFLAAAAGRRFHSKWFGIQALPRLSDGDGLRLGLTVTKRTGTAVERNRIKRRLRPACEKAFQPFCNLDFNIVIVAKRELLKIDFTDLISELEKAVSIVCRNSAEKKRHKSSDKKSTGTDQK